MPDKNTTRQAFSLSEQYRQALGEILKDTTAKVKVKPRGARIVSVTIQFTDALCNFVDYLPKNMIDQLRFEENSIRIRDVFSGDKKTIIDALSRAIYHKKLTDALGEYPEMKKIKISS